MLGRTGIKGSFATLLLGAFLWAFHASANPSEHRPIEETKSADEPAAPAKPEHEKSSGKDSEKDKVYAIDARDPYAPAQIKEKAPDQDASLKIIHLPVYSDIPESELRKNLPARSRNVMKAKKVRTVKVAKFIPGEINFKKLHVAGDPKQPRESFAMELPQPEFIGEELALPVEERLLEGLRPAE